MSEAYILNSDDIVEILSDYFDTEKVFFIESTNEYVVGKKNRDFKYGTSSSVE